MRGEGRERRGRREGVGREGEGEGREKGGRGREKGGRGEGEGRERASRNAALTEGKEWG